MDERRLLEVRWGNAFLWLAVLAAAVVLLWDTEHLWPMLIAIVGCGFTSVFLVVRARRPRR